MPEVSKIIGVVEIPKEILEISQKKITDVLSLKTKIESFLKEEITDLLNVVLAGAINLDSSDIHIEPQEKNAKIRIRLDGTLQDVTEFAKETYQTLVSRIKLLSGIKLNVSDRPQDGRFSVSLGTLSVEIRVSTLPSEYGESIVFRILNPKSLISLEELGMRADLLAILEKEIRKPNGMIIVTGPTGSGKTTTIYAFLKKVQKPEIKIITVEDPIEYRLRGISQTQVDPKKGYDFAAGLKSVMRQDPDVILVGEIRDMETVTTALQAALTGHLVFTTLHTNDASGTVARLQSLGEKTANIAPALNMVIAQRLARKTCEKCVKLEKAPDPVLKKIKNGLRNLPRNIKIPKIQKGLKIPQAKGCKSCNLTGYRGRIGIFELLLVDDEIEKTILSSPSMLTLKEKAVKRGMTTMYQDGIIKVLEGKTTIDEIEKITGE